MSDFLEACRREWKRLGVPDPVAAEMAADLEADLAQAREEGVAAEEVLGSGAFDPPGFAATWARERGVIPAPAASRHPAARWAVPLAFAAFAILTALGAAAAVLAFHGADVVGVARAASPHRLVSPLRDFTHPVGPPAEGLRPVAVVLLVVGLAGIALTAIFWLRRSDRSWRGPRAS
ncbi:MAG: hypothetical protein J0H06_10660 [Actinobacteria bacterium]|nr:hypothetical protein [Actinomycetota bacterium]OJU83684.1 MAG: hypothetical protein BGO11_21950 [Solirubrobacterales bacterium 70-9]